MNITRPVAWLAGAAAAGVAYAAVEAQCFALRRFDVPALPAGSAPLKLLHVSDMHMTPGQKLRARWVRSLASLEPDLVVTTGDNLGSARGLDLAMWALEPLLERPGAFVFGSNDYFSPRMKNPLRYLAGPSEPDHLSRPPDLPTGELRAGLLAAGWLDVNNARASLQAGGLDVALVGLADPHVDQDRMPPASGTSSQAGQDPSETPDAVLKLGVVHAPYIRAVDALVADGASLVLAGHTHGGQLALPFHGALVSNSDLPPSMAKGLHRWGDNAFLHVSAGVGAAPTVPLRFACRPEATLLTLVARKA